MATLKLPQPAPEIRSATVVRWFVGPGQSFAEGAPLVELEAEEAVLLVAANEAGALIRPLAAPRKTIFVGADLAQVDFGGAEADAAVPQASSSRREQEVNSEAATSDVSDATPILMPQAGNTMEEGTVLGWLVQEGDEIKLGQILCEIETDKATMEFESPASGRLARIVAAVDQPVAVKEVIAVVADSRASADAYLASLGTAPAAALAAADAAAAEPTPAKPSGEPAPQTATGRIKASPAARKLATQQGVALEQVGAGSGPDGRILSGDLAHAPVTSPVSATASSVASSVLSSVPGGPTGTAQRKPMSKMRRAIGANLQHSKQTIPHFYVRLTVDASPLQAFYQSQKPQTSCSLNDLVVLAVGRAMREFPAVRSQIDGDHIVEFPHANIGIAVGVEDGLVVPVVMNVDTLSLAELAHQSKRVVEAGRQGTLENFGKGNFTISNLGMFGVEEFSAIINPPESGILAVSAVREAVIVEDGALRIGRVMTMTLSADHRVVDGLLAAKFAGRLKQILENPEAELS